MTTQQTLEYLRQQLQWYRNLETAIRSHNLPITNDLTYTLRDLSDAVEAAYYAAHDAQQSRAQ